PGPQDFEDPYDPNRERFVGDDEPTYSAAHLKYLRERAVDPAVAWREGVRSLSESGARAAVGSGNFVGTALGFFYPGADPPSVRVQLDDREHNEGKTRAPWGVTPPPFVPTTVTVETEEPLVIVEAPAKALAMVSNGFPNTIGCGGVNAGIFEKGSDTLQPGV